MLWVQVLPSMLLSPWRAWLRKLALATWEQQSNRVRIKLSCSRVLHSVIVGYFCHEDGAFWWQFKRLQVLSQFRPRVHVLIVPLCPDSDAVIQNEVKKIFKYMWLLVPMIVAIHPSKESKDRNIFFLAAQQMANTLERQITLQNSLMPSQNTRLVK